MAANVQLLDGNDVPDTLERPGVLLCRYSLNRVGYALIVAVGGLMLAAAGYIWWQHGLAVEFWTALFTGLAAGGLGLSIHAAYWYVFARTRLVGMTEDKLVVGTHKEAWSIDWSVLDADKLGLADMEPTAVRGSLEVQVGAETIKLHLYNAYVRLDDLQACMSTLLDRMRPSLRGEANDRVAAQPSTAPT